MVGIAASEFPRSPLSRWIGPQPRVIAGGYQPGQCVGSTFPRGSGDRTQQLHRLEPAGGSPHPDQTTQACHAGPGKVLAITAGTDRSYFALRLQANVFQASGNLDMALSKLQEAINVHHRPHEAYQERGVILAQMGRLQDALSEFDEALRSAPNIAEYYYDRGTS